VPLAFANASLVICIIHAISTIPSFKIAQSLAEEREQDGDPGYYERLTQYIAPEVAQSPEVPVDDYAYAQTLQNQLIRVDQDQAYEELLIENAKKQSLQIENAEPTDISTPMVALSPLKPEATKGRPVKVRVRKLNGSIKVRNFDPNNRLSDVYRWLVKTEEKLPEFQLVTAYPRAVFKNDMTTLEETGIIQNPSSNFDLSQIFAIEEKLEEEKTEGDEVKELNEQEA